MYLLGSIYKSRIPILLALVCWVGVSTYGWAQDDLLSDLESPTSESAEDTPAPTEEVPQDAPAADDIGDDDLLGDLEAPDDDPAEEQPAETAAPEEDTGLEDLAAPEEPTEAPIDEPAEATDVPADGLPPAPEPNLEDELLSPDALGAPDAPASEPPADSYAPSQPPAAAAPVLDSVENDEVDLLGDLESSDIQAVEQAPAGQGGSQPPKGAELDGGLTSREDFGEVTSGTIFRQQKILDSAIKRLKYSRSDLLNGILISRGQRGVSSSPAFGGFTGLFRTYAGEMNDRNSFRVGGHTSLYYNKVLWDNTSHAHIDAIGFLTYSILPPLEVRLGASALGHKSGTNAKFAEEPLFQSIGDLNLGAKYTYSVYPFFHIFGLYDMKFYTRVGTFGPQWNTFSAGGLVGMTFDFRDQPWFDMPFPLRVHANVGYMMNRSSTLSEDFTVVSATSYYGLGLAPGDQMLLRFGLDVPWDPWGAYIEYTTDQVVLLRDERVRVNKWSQSPTRITPGFRYNPIENLTLDLSVDLSLGLQQNIKIFRALQPSGSPYAINFGVSYEWNPKGWGVFDLRGQLDAIVVDSDSGQPIPEAIIEYMDLEGYSSQIASSSTGEFVSYRLPPGPVTLRISREGYAPREIVQEIESREVSQVKYFLDVRSNEVEELGELVGEVYNRDGQSLDAVISFGDASIADARTRLSDGGFVKMLYPGQYQVKVESEGFEQKEFAIEIYAGQRVDLDVELISKASRGLMAGSISDVEGRPLSARVEFIDAQIDALEADAKGVFDRDLQPGIYVVRIALPGYIEKLLEIEIADAQTTNLNIVMESDEREGVISGRIQSTTGKPLAAIIVFDKDMPPLPTDPDDGSFLLRLPPGNYNATAQAPGYIDTPITFVVVDEQPNERVIELENAQRSAEGLARIEGDMIVTNAPVDFEPGTALMTETAFEVLADISKLALQDNVNSILIAVHTNNLGPSGANLALTEERAAAIVEYLAALGVPMEKLDGRGYGEDQPIASNETGEGREQNERVEFKLQ